LGKKANIIQYAALSGGFLEIEKCSMRRSFTRYRKLFTLDKADEAFELAEKGKPRGKIIIRI